MRSSHSSSEISYDADSITTLKLQGLDRYSGGEESEEANSLDEGVSHELVVSFPVDDPKQWFDEQGDSQFGYNPNAGKLVILTEYKTVAIIPKTLQAGAVANKFFEMLDERGVVAGDVVKPGKYSHEEMIDSGSIGEYNKYTFQLTEELTVGDMIDPTNVAEEDQSLFERIYHITTSSHCFMNTPFLDRQDDEGKEKYVVRQLTHGLFAREKIEGKGYDRVDVVGDVIGKGTYGSASTIKATLKQGMFTKGKLICNDGKTTRVVKRMKSKGVKFKATVDNESKLMSKAGFYKNRTPMYLEAGDSSEAFLSIKRFSGVELFDVITKDLKKYECLSLQSRLLLTISLLKELERNIHFRNVAHLDIKPGNVLVVRDLVNLCWQVKIIDLGLSTDKDKPRTDAVGTPLYVAPEFAVPLLNHYSDVYSMGRVIGVLWGDTELFGSRDSLQTFLSDRFDKKDRVLKLFYDVHDIDHLDKELKLAISEQIHGLIAHKPEDRSSLNSAIKAFEEIYCSYYLSTIDKKLHASVKLAFKYATIIDNTLRVFALDHAQATEDKLFDLATILDHVPCDIFEKNEHALRIFKQIVGVKALNSCKTIEEIKETVCLSIGQYLQQSEEIKRKMNVLDAYAKNHPLKSAETMDEEADLRDLRRFVRGFNSTLEQIDNCPLDLDRVVELTAHIDRKLVKMAVVLDKFNLLQDEQVHSKVNN